MKKRFLLFAALFAFCIGPAHAVRGYRRPIFRAKTANRTRAKSSDAIEKKRSSESKLPENLDEVYGPSILVTSFAPITEAKSTAAAATDSAS